MRRTPDSRDNAYEMYATFLVRASKVHRNGGALQQLSILSL